LADTLEATAELLAPLFPMRRSDSRKGENGKVLVVGGSWLYHGAPIHAAEGATRAGVDLVYLAVPRVIADPVRSSSADFIVFPLADQKMTTGAVRRLLKWLPEIDSAVIGPGLGWQPYDGVKLLCSELLSKNVKLTLDADALRKDVVSVCRGGNVVLTPHAGEFRRLTGEDLPAVQDERFLAVKKAAAEMGVVVLAKGVFDVISDGKVVYVNRTGCSAMTVGGTGDVLAGLVAGLMALKMDPLSSAVAASFVNGRAGEAAKELMGNHITASDLARFLPTILKGFDREESPTRE
jgi:ADP-dependent NAD(P)H-hydrate dehydratase